MHNSTLKKFIHTVVINETSRFKKETGKKHYDEVVELFEKLSTQTSLLGMSSYAFTMTDVEKVGVYPMGDMTTPAGVYFYPLTPLMLKQLFEGKLPYGSNRKYVGLVSLTMNSKQWLVINDNGKGLKKQSDLDKVRQFVGEGIWSYVLQSNNLDQMFYKAIDRYCETKSETGAYEKAGKQMIDFKSLLNKFGVYGVYDETGTIYNAEPRQIVVMNTELYDVKGIYNVEELRNAYFAKNKTINSKRLHIDDFLKMSADDQFKALMPRNMYEPYKIVPKSIFEKLSDRVKNDILDVVPHEVTDLLYKGIKEVHGSLNFSLCKTIKFLPAGIRVDDELRTDNSSIKKIGDNLYVGGDLRCRRSALISLPNNCTVVGTVNIDECSEIKELPKNLSIGGSLHLEFTDITTIPKTITVGTLNLVGTNVKTIEQGAKIKDLIIDRNCRVEKLPDNFSLRMLEISHKNARLTELPKNLHIAEKLELSDILVEKIIKDGFPEGFSCDGMISPMRIDLMYQRIKKTL